jgi:predicted DNA binding CopG/RHH family protein
MTNKRVIPHFASEAEEAQWWFDHSDELDKDFEQAIANGTIGRGVLAMRFGLAPNIVHLSAIDIEMARRQAAERGLDFEPYVQNLIHHALVKESGPSEAHGTATPAAA